MRRGVTLHRQEHLMRSVTLETDELILWEETWDMRRETMKRVEQETQRAAEEAEAENEALHSLLENPQVKQDS
jgi:hypothetical protein